MAVRTTQSGVTHKRPVEPHSAQPSQGTAGSRRKTLPHDDAAAERRRSSTARMRLGPSAKETAYERGRIPTTVNGRKKPPSEMKLKRRG
ncbi:MAG TPA: hypothetical protein VE782_01095 [Myxococcaceae bacterium]|nr:hypothetical protein [Myxococcaceae bacterium]